MAFCALIHKHHPNLIDYDNLDPSNYMANLQLAFDVAEKELDIPPLLDAKDVADSERPDDKSIMAYVAYYWKKFASSGKQQKSANMISKLGKKIQENEKIISDYEARAKKLIEWTNDSNKKLSDTSNFGNSLAKVQNTNNGFKSFKNEQKPKQNEEKGDLEITLKNLRSKQKNDGLEVYEPPKELSTEAINGHWDELGTTQEKYEKAIKEAILKMKYLERQLQKFQQKVKNLISWQNAKKSNELAEDVEKLQTIAAVQGKIKIMEAFDGELNGNKKALDEIMKVGQEIVKEGHEAAPSIEEDKKKTEDGFKDVENAAQEFKDKLEKLLKLKELIESKCIQIANVVQQFANLLENSSNALIEPASSNSVDEAEKKIEEHAKQLQTHKDNQAVLQKIKDLNDEIVGLGGDANTYSSMSYEQSKEKYEQVGGDLDKRTGELEKEKELQLSYVKLLSEWEDLCAKDAEWVEEKKKILEKEEDLSYAEQLKSIQTSFETIMKESEAKLKELSEFHEKLVQADIVTRAKVSFQTVTVSHNNIENIKKKRSLELEQKIKSLERTIENFKNRVGKVSEIQKTKTQYFTSIVSKVSTISAIQGEIKNAQEFEVQYKGIQDTFAETKKMGESIIATKHESSEEIKQMLETAQSSNEGLVKLAKETEEKLVQLLKQKQEIEEVCIKISKLVQQLNQFCEDVIENFGESVNVSSVKEVDDLISTFDNLEKDYGSKKADLDEISKLTQQVKDNNENPEVYSSMGLEAITSKYDGLKEGFDTKKQALAKEKETQQNNEGLLNELSKQFGNYKTLVSDKTSEVEKELTGELEEQIKVVREIGTKATEESKAGIQKLNELFAKIESADISEQAPIGAQDVTVLDAQLQKVIAKRIETIEAAILSKKQSNISESQLKDFRDTFKFFDKEKSGFLGKIQFKAACAAVGEDIPDEKLETTFTQFDQDKDGKISFDEFIGFISSVAKEGSGKDDLLQAFQDLTKGEKYISENAIRGNFDKDQAEYFLKHMKKTDEGYDYVDYINSTFAK